MDLNRKQKEYMVNTVFKPYEINKIFDCINKDWLINQDWKLKEETNCKGWYEVYVNNVKYTSVNFRTYPEHLDKLNSLNKEKDMNKPITFQEIYEKFVEHNAKNGIGRGRQFDDPKRLYAVVVFKESNWKEKYSLESRSYRFSSDNKYFIPEMIGRSIFAENLDKTDYIRLDQYIHEWKIDYCYLENDKKLVKKKEPAMER